MQWGGGEEWGAAESNGKKCGTTVIKQQWKKDIFYFSRLIFPSFYNLFHSGNNISCGEQRKTAKYKNIFL